MRLAITLDYAGNFKDAVKSVIELERAGLDMVWIPEAYGFDAITQVGYLAAVTDRVEIGTGIMNVFSRTPALVAMTAAGADYVSDGRFHLGLGASGPQVVEGFHGVPYIKPMSRVRDYIVACRTIWRREPFEYHGATIDAPLPSGQGTGSGKPLKLINHPLRDRIPIWWASLMGNSVAATAQHADGWIPIFFDPAKFQTVWGDDLAAGLAERDPGLGPLQINAGCTVAIGDNFVGDARADVLEPARRHMALYVGGMGSRETNFYNTIAQKYGYADEARTIQDLYLSGRKDEAAAAVPDSLLDDTNLVGPKSYVLERLSAFRDAGVTMLTVTTYGDDLLRTVEVLRDITG